MVFQSEEIIMNSNELLIRNVNILPINSGQ